MLPVVALTAGLGLSTLLGVKPGTYARTGAALLALAAFLSGFRYVTVSEKELIKSSYTYMTFIQTRSLGEYLRTNSSSLATVFVVGSEPEILFYSGLGSASRVYYFYPLVTPTLMTNKLRGETIVALIRRPPDFVVLVNETHSLGLRTVDGNTFVQELFGMFSHYRVIGVIADDSESLLTGDDDKMRSIAGKGAAMLLLGRPADDSATTLTFGELLGKRSGN
jgi:hypothetical protein